MFIVERSAQEQRHGPRCFCVDCFPQEELRRLSESELRELLRPLLTRAREEGVVTVMTLHGPQPVPIEGTLSRELAALWRELKRPYLLFLARRMEALHEEPGMGVAVLSNVAGMSCGRQ